MALLNACCGVSNSLPARIPFQGQGLPRKQLWRTCSQPAVNSDSSINSGFHRLSLRAMASEDSSIGASQYVAEGGDTFAAVGVEVEEKPVAGQNSYAEIYSSVVSDEEPPTPNVQAQSFELLENIDIKFDSEDTLSIALYGGGALVALWLTSAIVRAIDSIPLFPKLMELVGVGYTGWFVWRYLIFQESREELFAKISGLKQQVLGSEDD